MTWCRTRWWIAGTTCALAVAIGYLARPADEFASLRRFTPDEAYLVVNSYRGFDCYSIRKAPGLMLHLHILKFKCEPERVRSRLALVNSIGKIQNRVWELAVPSGRSLDHFIIADDPAKYEGVTCQIVLLEPDEPWYSRSWKSFRRRLGL